MNYIVNQNAKLVGPRGYSLDPTRLGRVVKQTNEVLLRLISFEDVDIMGILGLRNLSAAVGETFVAEMAKEYTELKKNPHQDGYPDLLLLDTDGKELLSEAGDGKAGFSPFKGGGYEVKATCGNIRTQKECAKRGIPRPGLGDQRIQVLLTHDWKSHHRQTNNLLGLLWDFIDGRPVIVAAFYSDELEESDWGKIVTPKEGEGRTTSVSILRSVGIAKMTKGWILMLDNPRYTEYVTKRMRKNMY